MVGIGRECREAVETRKGFEQGKDETRRQDCLQGGEKLDEAHTLEAVQQSRWEAILGWTKKWWVQREGRNGRCNVWAEHIGFGVCCSPLSSALVQQHAQGCPPPLSGVQWNPRVL